MPDKSLAAQISRVSESIVEKKVERAVEAHRNSLPAVARRDLPPKLKSLQSELNLLRNQLAPVSIHAAATLFVHAPTDPSAISRLARTNTAFYRPGASPPQTWFDPALLSACGDEWDMSGVVAAVEKFNASPPGALAVACFNLAQEARLNGIQVCEVDKGPPIFTPMVVLKATSLPMTLGSLVAVLAWVDKEDDFERSEGEVLALLANAMHVQRARKTAFGALRAPRGVFVYQANGALSREWSMVGPLPAEWLSRMVLSDAEALGFDLLVPAFAAKNAAKIRLCDLEPVYIGSSAVLYGVVGQPKHMVKVYAEKKELERETKALAQLAGVDAVPRAIVRADADENCVVLARHPLARLGVGASFLVLRDVLEALDKAHELGITHRGVRFDAILLVGDGSKAMLAEWGDSGGEGSVFAGFCLKGAQFASANVLNALAGGSSRVDFSSKDDLVALVKVAYYLAECGCTGMFVGEGAGSVLPGDWAAVKAWWAARRPSPMFAALHEAAAEGRVDDMKLLLVGVNKAF